MENFCGVISNRKDTCKRREIIYGDLEILIQYGFSDLENMLYKFNLQAEETVEKDVTVKRNCEDLSEIVLNLHKISDMLSLSEQDLDILSFELDELETYVEGIEQMVVGIVPFIENSQRYKMYESIDLLMTTTKYYNDKLSQFHTELKQYLEISNHEDALGMLLNNIYTALVYVERQLESISILETCNSGLMRLKVEADDYLCIICYDELKVAFNFKQKCQQSPLYRSTSEVRNVSFKIEPLTSSEIPSSSCNSERNISAVEENDAKITTTIIDEEDASELDESQDSHRYNTQCSPQNTRYISEAHGELSPEDEYIVEVIDHQEFPLDISDKEDLDMPLSKNEQDDNIQNDDKDSIDIIKCEVCDKLFTKTESHRRHLYRQHSIGKRGKRIPRDEHRKGPIPNYEEDDLFKNLGTTQCEYCFTILDTYEERKQHETKHKDEDRPYRCNNEDCSARFKDRYSVRNHIRIHSDFKQYKCRFCDQRFHQRGNAKAHERCHTGEKPFVCPHCGKGFAEKGNLKSHIRFHTGERPYSCSHCSKTFRTHYSHKIHVRSHTQEKPFLCSDCGKSFNCSGKLRIHKRIHTGHRPYMCDLCGASFMDSSRLKRHTKIH